MYDHAVHCASSKASIPLTAALETPRWHRRSTPRADDSPEPGGSARPTSCRNINKPRITDVCDAIDLPWRTLAQFGNNEGWTILMG